MGSKINIMEDIIKRTRIAEGDISKLNIALERIFELLWFFWVFDEYFGVKDVCDSFSRYSCPGKKNEHHRHH